MKIGIPKALLYYRYGDMWKSFFEGIGAQVVLSPDTNKEMLDLGAHLSIDEGCLSMKIFLGHVNSIIDECDYVFVPRIANWGWTKSGIKEIMCPRFESVHDVTRNTFRDRADKILGFEIDYIDVNKSLGEHTEESAYLDIGRRLGADESLARQSYKNAKAEDERLRAERAAEQERIMNGEGQKILLLGHGYVLHDPYVGSTTGKILRELGAETVYADRLDRASCLDCGGDLSYSVPWEVNREMFGAIEHCRGRIDGIALMTAFPCGPDSMTNEMIVRCVKDIPVITLIIDNQDGSAGLETRLESFVDILNFRRDIKSK